MKLKDKNGNILVCATKATYYSLLSTKMYTPVKDNKESNEDKTQNKK